MEALPETANTRAFLRKGRYDTTRLSQRRARWPIRRQLAVRCAEHTSYKRGESSKLYRKGRFIYRKERFEPRHALTTLQRREAGYPRGHNRHNIYHTYYSAVYSACRLLSGRPTAVTTGTMFITLTTVQSILHADYRQGGLYSFIATHSLLKLNSTHHR